MITKLLPHEVFVFGSNATGFHGAGGAGLACRRDSRNTWRDDPWFLKAMKSPYGSPDRIGKWAIYGQAVGYQEGKEGKSYAIVTVTRPRARRSVPLSQILKQVIDLIDFAYFHYEMSFLLTPLGTGYAGYSQEEMMREVWEKVMPLPENFNPTYFT